MAGDDEARDIVVGLAQRIDVAAFLAGAGEFEVHGCAMTGRRPGYVVAETRLGARGRGRQIGFGQQVVFVLQDVVSALGIGQFGRMTELPLVDAGGDADAQREEGADGDDGAAQYTS